MIKRPDTNAQRKKRHKRVRSKISGTPDRPRLNVFRSERHIYAQVIDDTTGHTMCSASSVEKAFESSGSNKEAARKVGDLPILLLSALFPRALTPLYSTAADISTTGASKSLQKRPARAG